MPDLEVDIQLLVAIGGPLTVSQLAETLGVDPDEAMMVCDDLVDRGLVVDGAVGLVDAGSDIDVSNARRTLLAERLAAVLDDAGVDPERLGRLHVAAGRPDRAFPLLEGAATDPALDHEAAIELLALAIESAPRDVEPSIIGGLFLARARRHRNAGLTMPALRDATEAISHLTGEERVDALALASVLADDRQHAQESERWAAMALLEAGRLGAHPKSASLLSLHARELARLGFAHEAAREQSIGLDLAAAEGNEVQQFYTLLNAARIELDAGDVRSAVPSYQHLRDLAERLEGPVSVADKEAYLARGLLLAGNVRDGLACIEHAREIAEQTGAIAVDFLCDVALVEGFSAFHRYDAALQVSERVVEAAEFAFPAWRNRAEGYRAAALIGLERREDAQQVIQQALVDTPSGGDGLRLRLWLRCREMAAGDGWDRHEAENLTDLLVQSGWHQTAAEFMVTRAERERSPDLAGEAAAIAYRLGQPMLAADALEAGRLWSSHTAAVVADRLREVELSLPDDWRDEWVSLPAVRSGLAVDVREDSGDADALRREVEAVMGGLDSADVLSPAQRITSGAVRRSRRIRTVARTAVQAVAVAALAVLIVVIVVGGGGVLTNHVDVPEGGLSGAAPLAGDVGRTGVFEGTFGEPIGIYWDAALGGFFEAAPVIFGESLLVGSSEGRLYSINLPRGTTTFETRLPDRIDVASAVYRVPGFGEGGQAGNIAFFGSVDGTLVARTLSDTATELWRFETGGPISGPPIVIGQTVYVASADGHVYAIDGPGGFEVARFPDEPVEGGFTRALAVDDRFLYAVGGGDLYMLDIATLEPKCVVDLPARAEVVTHPVVAEGAVFVGTSLQTIAVFEPGNCGAAPAGFSPSHQVGVPVKYAPVVRDGVIWVAADELVMGLDPTSRESDVLDVVDVGGVITSQPVISGDSLIMATEGGRLVSVDVGSLSIEWEVDEFESEIRAPVAVVNGVAVVVTARGDLYALADG